MNSRHKANNQKHASNPSGHGALMPQFFRVIQATSASSTLDPMAPLPANLIPLGTNLILPHTSQAELSVPEAGLAAAKKKPFSSAAHGQLKLPPFQANLPSGSAWGSITSYQSRRIVLQIHSLAPSQMLLLPKAGDTVLQGLAARDKHAGKKI